MLDGVHTAHLLVSVRSGHTDVAILTITRNCQIRRKLKEGTLPLFHHGHHLNNIITVVEAVVIHYLPLAQRRAVVPTLLLE
jgi:hypothetical protein